ncbi:phosphate acyltransferase [Rhodopirellula sallentina]|uniref:Phosphate butyryltransferase n=1 Tax=Rhodopirellula sallentina SM41 TaxID=1263870 RepID=M5U1V4_9BACT|nr:phosphate acyltransferase [Rhodopirellula sallentina]EMI51831.1 phosphate butyryltransferase [Rhodopirellula sallentina SM41]
MGLQSFDQLFARADANRHESSVVVAGGNEATVLHALTETTRRGWTRPILCGPVEEIESVAATENVPLDHFQIIDSDQPAVAAVECIRRGQAVALMKGRIATPDLMRAVLHSKSGLKTGRTICQIVMMEIPKDHRQFLMADTGITIEPTIQQATEIVESTARVAMSLGCTSPRIAIMAASEKVTDAMPETHLAAQIAAAIETSLDMQIQGPLSFDLAYSTTAGEKKGLGGEVIGSADAMVFPNLLSANLTVKAIMYTADCRFGGMLAGAACPIVFMSRADNIQTRIRSLALALHPTQSDRAH